MMTAPLCGLCGKRTSVYVCQGCGRTVCAGCFDAARWSCNECLSRLERGSPTIRSPTVQSFTWATWLFFAAFAIIFIGIVLMTLGSISNLNLNGTSGGAVILIGPIPIVIGAGQNSFAIVALAVFLTIFAVLFFLLLRKRGSVRGV